MTLLFVYGTLKRGGSNHRQLSGQTFVATGRTVPGYRLFDLGDFPGMVSFPSAPDGVEGEVWSVDDAALLRLDDFEGVAQGLYRREPVALLAPFAGQTVQAYLYSHSVEGRRDLGSIWSG